MCLCWLGMCKRCRSGESALVRQMEALEGTLAEERRTARAKEARHKLMVERLRRHIVELQVRSLAMHLAPSWLAGTLRGHAWRTPLKFVTEKGCADHGDPS